MSQNRFQDENRTISEFRTDVLVVCPKCEKKAFTKLNYEDNSARLFCENCGYIEKYLDQDEIVKLK